MIEKKWHKKISTLLIIFLFGLQIQPLFLGKAYADEGEQIPVVQVEGVQEEPLSSSESVQTEEVSLQNQEIVEASEIGNEEDSDVGSASTSSIATSTAAFTSETISSTSTATTTEQTDEILATSTPEFPDFITTSTTTPASTATSSTATSSVQMNASSSENEMEETETPIATSTEDGDSDEDASGELPTGTTTIETGDSVALANILNIVNTNLVNSTGSIVMANMYDGYEGTIDFRNSNKTSSSSCTLSGCNGIDSITAKINADANIDNVLAVVATTGGNVIDTAESAIIKTGNTIAGLNLVNVANTNFIDSSYFLLSLNAFNTINGDIVLPSLVNLFANANTTGSHVETSHVTQSASVSNNLDISANAGENMTEASNGVIHTGNTNSVTNIYNNINSSLVGGTSISLLLKVTGAWVGQLFGLPSGNVFVEDGNSRIFHYENGALVAGSGTTTVQSTTTATINNDIQVRADSGKNETVDTENSVIDTGDSFAAANIINVANSNIIGRNWIMAIINVFGDLNGNISFGRPDLWLGEQVSADNAFIQNGTRLTYKITVINKGDMTVTQVKPESRYDLAHLTIIDSDSPYTETSQGVLQFDIGTLAPDEAKEITFNAVIKDTAPGADIINTSSVTGHEPDNNLDDNTDSTTITTSISSGGGNNTTNPTNPPVTPPITPQENPTVSISPITVQVIRQNASSTIMGARTKGEQSLTIKNLTGNTMPDVVFRDMLYDKNGTNIQTEIFDLGDILPFEEITVSYNISFNETAKAGVYTLSSRLDQTGRGTLNYPNNGSITFIQYGVGGHNDGEITAHLISTSTPLASAKPATTTLKRTVRKGSVLGAFIEASSPQIAYAQVEGVDAGSERTAPVSLMYLILFLLAILLRIYYKYFYKQDTRESI